MGKIISKKLALNLIKTGKARGAGLVYDDGRGRSFVAIDRLDDIRVDHVAVGDGDLRDTPAGEAVEVEFGRAPDLTGY